MIYCNFCVYNAAGGSAQITAAQQDRTTNDYDGLGQVVKQVKTGYNTQTEQYTSPVATQYFIRSTVLGGQVISEPTPDGHKKTTYIYAGGSIVAKQYQARQNEYPAYVLWQHGDPNNASLRHTDANGAIFWLGEEQPVELDAAGAAVGGPVLSEAPVPEEGAGSSTWFPYAAPPGQQRVTYAVDGIPVSYEYFLSQAETATVGGRFGLLEMSARASRGRYLGSSYTYRDRNGVTGNILREQALGFQRESHGEITQTNHWLVNEGSWTAALNLLPPAAPPASQTPQQQDDKSPSGAVGHIDPCAGKKGQLDHFPANPNWGIPHITPRHIEQTPQFQGKKSYYTFGLLTSSTIAKQTAVMNLNQEAFEKGVALPSHRGRIAYSYAPYEGVGHGPWKVEGFTAGRDASQGFQFTNVRTVVVDSDCKTVITSFPGFPGGIKPSDPRFPTAHWWNAINTGL